VPARAMGFNVVCSLVVVSDGGAVEIYTFSNVGYTGSFLSVLVGYYLLRKYRPQVHRPFRLPEFFKYIALGMAALFAVVWLYGGISYARIGNTEIYYFLGWAVALAYIPLYLYRTRVEDKKVAQAAERETVMPPGAVPSE
jgi:amino acid transporter